MTTATKNTYNTNITNLPQIEKEDRQTKAQFKAEIQEMAIHSVHAERFTEEVIDSMWRELEMGWNTKDLFVAAGLGMTIHSAKNLIVVYGEVDQIAVGLAAFGYHFNSEIQAWAKDASFTPHSNLRLAQSELVEILFAMEAGTEF
jgi:hypothetical protein